MNIFLEYLDLYTIHEYLSCKIKYKGKIGELMAKTIETLKKVTLDTPWYTPQIDLSDFQLDDGELVRGLRFCYYTKKGMYTNRPLFINEEKCIDLLVKAFKEKLFTDDARQRLIDELKVIKPNPKSPNDLYGRYKGDISEEDFKELKEQSNDKQIGHHL